MGRTLRQGREDDDVDRPHRRIRCIVKRTGSNAFDPTSRSLLSMANESSSIQHLRFTVPPLHRILRCCLGGLVLRRSALSDTQPRFRPAKHRWKSTRHCHRPKCARGRFSMTQRLDLTVSLPMCRHSRSGEQACGSRQPPDFVISRPISANQTTTSHRCNHIQPLFMVANHANRLVNRIGTER